MNYFEFYGIPVSFVVNEAELKKKYFELSKKYHPDYFVSHSEEKQHEVLQLSTLNTKALQALSDFDKRMKYVLELKGKIYEGEKYVLAPEFLMEMMEINEGITEMKTDEDNSKIHLSRIQIEKQLNELYNQAKSAIENYNDKNASEEQLRIIKDYYYKKKYLLRIKESLDSFGGS